MNDPVVDDEKEQHKGELEQELIVEGKRNRRSVERFEIKKESPRTPERKYEGNGTPLGKIPYIKNNINTNNSETLRSFYRILYGCSGKKATLKSELKLFKGFMFQINSNEYLKKKMSISKLSSEDLRVISNVLEIYGSTSKDDKVNEILDFLMNPQDLRKPKLAKKRHSSEASPDGATLPKREKQDFETENNENTDSSKVMPKIKKRVSFEDEQEAKAENTKATELRADVTATIKLLIENDANRNEMIARSICDEVLKRHPDQNGNVGRIKRKAVDVLQNVNQSV